MLVDFWNIFLAVRKLRKLIVGWFTIDWCIVLLLSGWLTTSLASTVSTIRKRASMSLDNVPIT
jgi:hypothetical protein